ncbi:MAG: hypothetical protein AUH89_01510 [Ktedonobacter sp. 13_1_40CM_4_52_4]|nr:MAG: hypothetical protein AUH89_01510 [Ktedonobacter sp. 13_1_40CM_4_52_4]
MIPEFIKALRQLNIEPTDEDVADILWLSLQMASLSSQSGETLRLPEEDIKKPRQSDESISPPPASATEYPKSIAPSKPVRAELFIPSQQRAKHEGSGELPFRSPATTALPKSLDIARALRPLMQRVPSRTQFVLDEEKTAQLVAEQLVAEQLLAEQYTWIPALIPLPSHWLELAFVVDESRSMHIWRQTVVELKLLLERLGAFRNIRTWGLVTNANRSKVQIHTGLGLRTDRLQLRDPGELIDPGGRRLILVISDCVSSIWHEGLMAQELTKWARKGPVAIIQVLPQRLWSRSALGDAVEIRLHARSPGLPNIELDYEPSSYLIDKEELKGQLPIPVVTLVEQESLKKWVQASLIAGNTWAPGYMLNVLAQQHDSEANVIQQQKVTVPTTAELRLKRFRATASPMARALAGLLAAVDPISFPVVRLIQHTMLPNSDLGHVAEVFLGGLLEQLPTNGNAINPDAIQYDFVEGVRELLLDSMPLSESIKVLKAVSAFVESRADQSLGIDALLADPRSTTGLTIGKTSRPFATVTTKVLRRFGGDYAALASDIEEMLSETQAEPSNKTEQDANTIDEASNISYGMKEREDAIKTTQERLKEAHSITDEQARTQALIAQIPRGSMIPTRIKIPPPLWTTQSQQIHTSHLIVVSNDGPFEYYLTPNETLKYRRSTGAMAMVLVDVWKQTDMTWVAMARTEGDRMASRTAQQQNGGLLESPLRGQKMQLRYVAIPKTAYHKHDEGISNQVLWFLQHYLYNPPEDSRSIQDAWTNGYCIANRAIADAVIAEIERKDSSAVVMLHDYHLYLAPAMIRRHHPSVLMQQFIHIPWPDVRSWHFLPSNITHAIYSGLVGNDIIGFQTERGGRTLLEGAVVDFEEGAIWWQGHRTQARAYPISISVVGERRVVKSAVGKRAAEKIRPLLGEKTIMRVDRIEPTKNILRGFQAYAQMLDEHPELLGKVTFLAFLVPSHQALSAYQRYNADVLKIIDEINQKYGSDEWTPIHAFRDNDRTRALAAMQFYDVLLVNPIIDGMNLVAKEGPVVNQCNGVLVLSRTAGAFQQLGKSSIPISPMDVTETSQALYQALTLSYEERAVKAKLAQQVVEHYNLNTWLTRQIRDINALLDRPAPS